MHCVRFAGISLHVRAHSRLRPRQGATSVGVGGVRRDLEDVGKAIADKKVVVGAIDRHTLQVESPPEVAALARLSLKHIPAERLMFSSDCGMGREGMSRRHASGKMVSLVQGANIVKKDWASRSANRRPRIRRSR